MKWRNGGICPSLQKSLEAWAVKKLTTVYRTRPEEVLHMRFSSEQSAVRSSISAWTHQCAFGTLHQRYLRVPEPHCTWLMSTVSLSSGAIQQVCKREARVYLSIWSVFMAMACLEYFWPLSTGIVSAPAYSPSLNADAASPHLHSPFCFAD